MRRRRFDVFVSYRRKSASPYAAQIRDRLRSAGYHVYLDVVDKEPGRFRERLAEKIKVCSVFVIILSKDAFVRTNRGDVFLAEVRTAIDIGVNIVPVLIEDYELTSNSEDPLIKKIAEFEGVRYRHETYDQTMSQLESLISTLAKRTFSFPHRFNNIQVFKQFLVVVVLLTSVLGFAIWRWMSLPDMLVPGYGLAFPSTNEAKASLDASWEDCEMECFDGVSKKVHLRGFVEENGFAVLNLFKMSAFIGVWNANIADKSHVIRLVANCVQNCSSDTQAVVGVEVALKDRQNDEVHFKCVVPNDGLARDFLLPINLVHRSNIDLHRIMLLSIGPSSSAGMSGKAFRISVLGLVPVEQLNDAKRCEKLW